MAVASSCLTQATPGRAQTASPIMKSASRIRESLPAIGLGTFLAFDRLPGEPREDLESVMRQFWDAGGRVVDTSPLYGMGEVNVGDLAARLGINDRLFVTNKIWSTGEYLGDRSHAQRSLENSMQRLWRKQIDVMMCHSLVNAGTVVPLLKIWREEGRIRYAGVSHHELPAFPELAGWVERGDLDVVQVHYSIAAREAEQRILPAAAERGMAVMVNMPFEKGRLFKLVEGRSLPDFAREIGVRSSGAVLPQVDRFASRDHLRAARHSKSAARRGQHGRVVRPATRSGDASADAAPHGVDTRLRSCVDYRALPRTEVSGRDRARKRARLTLPVGQALA